MIISFRVLFTYTPPQGKSIFIPFENFCGILRSLNKNKITLSCVWRRREEKREKKFEVLVFRFASTNYKVYSRTAKTFSKHSKTRMKYEEIWWENIYLKEENFDFFIFISFSKFFIPCNNALDFKHSEFRSFSWFFPIVKILKSNQPFTRVFLLLSFSHFLNDKW